MYEMVVVISVFIQGEAFPIIEYTSDYLFRSQTGCYISLVVDDHSITGALIENEDISDEVVNRMLFEGYCNEI